MLPRSLRLVVLCLLFAAAAAAPGCSCDETTDPNAACGDGVVDGGEQCDDGNESNGDGCSASCTIESSGPGGGGTGGAGGQGGGGSMAMCGNGVLEAGEDCDDGNDVTLDGCESDCTASPDEIVCERLMPLPSGEVCEVVAGDANKYIVGDVLAPWVVYRGGGVLVDATGNITCVGCDCEPMAQGATVVRCPTGVVSPGLINAHDHITFTQGDPYNDTGERYEHRHEWRLGLNGHTEIPSTGNASNDEKSWGELRFVMSGATSTIGSGSVAGFLRNLDRAEQEGLNQEQVHYETFPLGDSGGTLLDASCAYPSIITQMEIAMDDSFFPHISEGVDAFAQNEFRCVSGAAPDGEDLLEPQSAFIHSIGLGPLDYSRMASEGTTLVWSPRSNITLYGNTAVVTAADRLGVRIALGTDWMPTGSMNMQRELQCADSLNGTYYADHFTDRDLWRMATLNAAQAAAVDDVVGTLQPGLVADIAIYDGTLNDAWRAVIDGAPQDTVLVMRGGEVLYGNEALVTALGVGGCDPLDVCSAPKLVCATAEIGKSLAALTTSVGTIYPLFFCTDPPSEPSCKPMRPDPVSGSTVYSGDPTGNDNDGDGVANANDNCVDVFNPVRPVDQGDQGDYDGDGDGDACDPCPLQPDVTLCSGPDPTDADLDGIVDAMDNCPDVPNAGQEDEDNDDKGDACDPCPMVSNPGPAACPATIYEIKGGTATGVVAVQNALVTGCRSGSGFFLQVKPGDPDYTVPEGSGVYVYHPGVTCGTTLDVGDRVTLDPTTIANFFGQIQLTDSTVTVVASMNEAPPPPVDVSPAMIAGTSATPLEAVIVRVQNVIVTDVAPTPGPADSPPINEFVVDGVLRVNDFLHLATPFPPLNQVYLSITGIADYRNGNQKLEPRDAADLVPGAPILVDLGPVPAFVREGQMGVTTIPTPMEVVLSGPAQGDTFVMVSSAVPASLGVVGGGVTVPNGSSSAPVLLNGNAQALAVDLTATLAGVMITEPVRVVGPGEVPQAIAISPSGIVVPPMGSAMLDVVLDIPAGPGGANVGLSLVPGMFGTVPPSVLVPADQLLGTFTFTANAMTGTETLTASFGGGMPTATIDVQAGSGLVINELDYDQIGGDTGEFVEILNVTQNGIDLTGLSLALVNSGVLNCAVMPEVVDACQYNAIDLSPAGILAPGQYLVIGTASVLANVPMTAKTIPFAGAQDNVQNGPADALAIVDAIGATLLDALSYEGSVNMGKVTNVGIFDFVEGSPTGATDSNAVDASLSRLPNGQDTDNASGDWVLSSMPTPGAANAP
jgi:cysteine-rich repeat protein